MATLPRPSVTARQIEGYKTEVVITRDGKSKTFTSQSSQVPEATRQIVEQVISDPTTAEWLPGKEK